MAVHQNDGRYNVAVNSETYPRIQAILSESGCKIKVHVVHDNGDTLLRVWKYGTKADVAILPQATGDHFVSFTPVGLFSKKASHQLCHELSKILDEHASNQS